MDNNENEKRDRIERLIEIEGLSQRSFADKVGINTSNLNQVLLGNRPVPKTLPSKIVTAFPEIRLEWLLYGEGEMYVEDQQLADKTAIREHMYKLPTKPRLPKFMSEGRVTDYYKGKRRSLCTERPIIYNLVDYDFSLILKSNRMSPKYERGDELFFKETNIIKDGDNPEWCIDPEWGEEFLLDTDTGLRFKRIYPAVDKKGEECIRCVSYNREEYPDFMVPRKSIHAIYRFVGALRIK